MTRRPRATAVTRRLALPLLLAGAVMPWSGSPAPADGPGPGQTRAQYETRVRENKARQIELMSQGARRRMEAAKRWAAAVRAAKRRGLPLPSPGGRRRPAPVNEDGGGAVLQTAGRTALRLRASATATVAPNSRANNPLGEAVGTTQSEESIAARGNFVLVAWNDGNGGPHYQGYGYSIDGGQTFTDGGAPPGLAGWVWESDPSVTVDEKTGTFYYSGLVDASATTNGIGVVPATFVGGALSWGTPVLARSVSNVSAVLDKQWLVADSTTGHLYLTYTTFDGVTGDHIDFQKSTDGGASWTAAVQISGAGDNGAVQGSRPAVGPAGELYVTWSAIGAGAEDYLRLRKSSNQGGSWGPEVTPAALYLNFGTGAPGFNRERGVDFPSISVDRTSGPNRGRVHLAWTESINKYDDVLNTLGSLVEGENNDSFNRANPFSPGQRLRGSLGSTTDFDCFSFSAAQGVNYVFECDSIPLPLYTLRVFCGQDTTTRLALSGDLSTPAGGRGYVIWTAPTTGTYFLRVAYVSGGSIGGYRISTGSTSAGPERGRDSRDVYASHSDDGAAWSVPVLVNDAAARYCEYLPEINVAADGMPYVSWFDWHDDGCGGRSFQYLSRSGDGGATWSASQRFSDVQNDWTVISLNSNLAPDMGDYSHMHADARHLRPAWADGRGGGPDVYTTRIDTWHELSACQGDLGADPGTSVSPSWTLRNLNSLFGNTYGWTLTSQRNWPMTGAGAVAAAADGTTAINLSVAVPDTAAPGVNRLCLTVTNAKGTRSQQCCFDLNVQASPVDVPPLVSAFDLKTSVPNPATHLTRIAFSLPYGGAVQLRIFGLRGELVRTLVDGDRPAGPNAVTWDGRDNHGAPAGAGAYFCRLEGFGKVRVQRLVWLR